MVEFGIIITIILCFLGIVFGKSKFVYALQIIWMWILMAFNVGGSDYATNENIFLYTGKMERGLSAYRYGINYFLARFFYRHNLDFKLYTVVTVTLAILIISYIVMKNCDFPATALSFFYVYPLFDSVIQDRFFIAMVICLLAFHFWLKEKMIIYYILIVIAVTFHSSLIIYLVYPLLIKIIKGNRKWLIVPVVGIIFILFQNGGALLSFFDAGIATKFSTYSGLSNYGTLFIQFIFVLLEIGAIASLYRSIPKTPEEDTYNSLLAQWNLASFSFIPFLITNSIYLRWFRLINIFNYFYAANNIHKIKNRKLLRFNLIVVYLIIILVQGYMTFSNGEVIDSVFNYNSFLMW